ncbi:MAG: ATP synthase F1 subunit epsilon [Nitrospiria bacterium]
MTLKPFHLTVITPDQVFFEGQVGSMVVPGGTGSFGILANHAPLLSTLDPGRLVLTKTDGGKQYLRIGAGFIDILNNDVTLLTESIETEKSS